jgi:hypothetical protein
VDAQVSLLLIMVINLRIRKCIGDFCVIGASSGLVFSFGLLINLRSGVGLDFLFRGQAPLLNLPSTILLILDLYLGRWLDRDCCCYILT